MLPCAIVTNSDAMTNHIVRSEEVVKQPIAGSAIFELTRREYVLWAIQIMIQGTPVPPIPKPKPKPKPKHNHVHKHSHTHPIARTPNHDTHPDSKPSSLKSSITRSRLNPFHEASSNLLAAPPLAVHQTSRPHLIALSANAPGRSSAGRISR